jgi:hypothetical protein
MAGIPPRRNLTIPQGMDSKRAAERDRTGMISLEDLFRGPTPMREFCKTPDQT